LPPYIYRELGFVTISFGEQKREQLLIKPIKIYLVYYNQLGRTPSELKKRKGLTGMSEVRHVNVAVTVC
jgi:hypothetical protein